MRIRHRLLLMSALPAALVLMITAYTWIETTRVVNQASLIFEQRMDPIWKLDTIGRSYAKAVDIAHLSRAQMLLPQEAEQQMAAHIEQIETNWRSYLAGKRSALESELISQRPQVANNALAALQTLQSYIEQQETYSMGGYIDMQLYPALQPMQQLLDQLIATQNTLALAEEEASRHSAQSSLFKITLLSALMITVMAITGWLGYRSILTPVRLIRDKVQQIEVSRDLTLRSDYHKTDEMGELSAAFNKMLDNFNRIMADMRSNGQQLNQASSELAGLADETGQLVRYQVSSSDNNAAEIDQVFEAAQQVRDGMQAAAHEIASVTSRVNEGNGEVQSVVASIEQASRLIAQTSREAAVLRQHTDKVGTVLDVINSIAEQTNLLALNAAIEAARAGEQGRGFAVVADEVRTLAQRTADSTQEIQQLVQDIQAGAQQTESQLANVNESSQQTLQQARSAGLALTAIEGSVQELEASSQQVTHRTREQLSLSQSIQIRSSDIAEQCRSTEAKAAQTAALGQTLSQLAEKQKSSLMQFKTTG